MFFHRFHHRHQPSPFPVLAFFFFFLSCRFPCSLGPCLAERHSFQDTISELCVRRRKKIIYIPCRTKVPCTLYTTCAPSKNVKDVPSVPPSPEFHNPLDRSENSSQSDSPTPPCAMSPLPPMRTAGSAGLCLAHLFALAGPAT